MQTLAAGCRVPGLDPGVVGRSVFLHLPLREVAQTRQWSRSLPRTVIHCDFGTLEREDYTDLMSREQPESQRDHGVRKGVLDLTGANPRRGQKMVP